MLALILLWQILQPTTHVRDEARELRQGQAMLRPRFDKDEAAFKQLASPAPETVKAEHDMQLCFSVARSTKGMYNIPDGQEMKPNCDRQFIALEKILAGK